MSKSPTYRLPSEPRMQQLNGDTLWPQAFDNLVKMDFALVENRIQAIHATIADATGITEVIQRGNGMTEVEHLRAKLRMIVSHATGGAMSDEHCINLPTNEISVRITEHVNVVYAAGKKDANEKMIDMLKKCREQFFKYQIMHSVKKTPDGDLKAKTNADMVQQISIALTAAAVVD